MAVKLKKPQWVVCDEGWELFSKDRFFMEYVENGISYLVEVDHAIGSTGVYMDTLKPINQHITLTDKHKKIIKERIFLGFKVMGVTIEFC